MIRGTTPKVIFNLPIETSQISIAYVTFKNDKGVLVEKTLAQCTLESNKIIASLTQVETLSFEAGRVQVQLKAKLKDGTVIGSRIRDIRVGNALKEDVI